MTTKNSLLEAELAKPLDTENVYLLFISFLGDVKQTAAAVGVAPILIEQLAADLHWNDKLAPILESRKTAKPGSVERSINRAVNFVIAHRFRCAVERVVRSLVNMTDEELREQFFDGKVDKNGNVLRSGINARGLADLAAALEKAQLMSYLALDDTPTARVKRTQDEQPPEMDEASIHAQIARAMSGLREESVAISGRLAREQALNCIKAE